MLQPAWLPMFYKVLHIILTQLNFGVSTPLMHMQRKQIYRLKVCTNLKKKIFYVFASIHVERFSCLPGGIKLLSYVTMTMPCNFRCGGVLFPLEAYMKWKLCNVWPNGTSQLEICTHSQWTTRMQNKITYSSGIHDKNPKNITVPRQWHYKNFN